jgi:hypothetical protein
VAPERRRPPLQVSIVPSADLTPERRARLEAILARPPRQRLDGLIDADDAAALVPAIPADDFASLLLEVGLQDGDVLLSLSSDEQLVHLVDLTAWEGDRLDVPRTVETLETLRGADPEVLLRWMRSADDASLLTLCSRLCIVTSEDIPPPARLDEAEVEAPFSIDGAFLIWPLDPEREGFLRWLLTTLFESHQETYFWICQSLQWSVESDLEEEAFGLRRRRLIEHGFPTPEDGAAIFRPAPAAELATVRVVGAAPPRKPGEAAIPDEKAITLVPPDVPGIAPFIRRCTERLEPSARTELRLSLDRLSRIIVSAELLDPGKPEDRAAAQRLAARTVSIALEHLSGGDEATGAALCVERRAIDLFRIGHTLVLELHRRASAIRRSGWLSRLPAGAVLLDLPLRRAYDASRLARPRRFVGVDDDGKVRTEPFASLAELAEGQRLLATVEALGVLLVEGLGLPPDFQDRIDLAGRLPDSWKEVSAGDILRTALVHGVATGKAVFEPVSSAGLGRFVQGAIDAGKLRPSFRAEATALLLARLSAGRADVRKVLEPYLATVLDRLEEEVGRLDSSKPIDPRFVGGMVRSTG